MKRILKSNLLAWIMLAVIILSQLSYITYVFVFEKEGFHSDEMYSYGLSNSYRNPFLSIESHVDKGGYTNVNKWIPGSDLNDYLVVNDGEAFDYANVWYNQSRDRHPPLYYTILHTICSFFPNRFSPWFGFSINIAVFIVLQIFLFLLSRNLLKSRWLALVPCLCYGFSTGAVDTFIFIRMYALMTTLTVILAYLHSRLLEKDKPSVKDLIPIAIVTMLGALTQHEFTIIAFVIAVCFCVYYLCKKRFKGFFMYGCSMALGVLLAWAVFPHLMAQIFSEGSRSEIRGRIDVVMTQFFDSVKIPFHEMFGIRMSSFVPASIVILLFIAIILLVPLLLLKRDKVCEVFKRCAKKINPLIIAMLFAAVTITLLTANTGFHALTGYIDRYLFCIFPFVLLLVVCGLYCICKKIKIIRKYSTVIIAVVLAALTSLNVLTVKPGFLFEGIDCDELAELTAGKNCVVEEYGSLWRLVCFSNILRYSDNVFYTEVPEFSEKKSEINAPPSDSPYAVFILKEADDIIKELDFYDSLVYKETVTVYSREYNVYVQH